MLTAFGSQAVWCEKLRLRSFSNTGILHMWHPGEVYTISIAGRLKGQSRAAAVRFRACVARS